MSNKKAVLLMSYGTPYEISDIMGYYTNIRNHHEPPKPLYDELVSRYKAIGGTSPLAKISDAQAKGLQAQLDQEFPGEYQVFVGYKYIHPFIQDTVKDILATGIKTIYGIPLAPHYSAFNTGDYHARAKEVLVNHGDVTYVEAKSWWQNDDLIHFWSDQLVALKPQIDQLDTKVILSAHSLPMSIIDRGDSYRDEVEANMRTVVKTAGLTPDQYTIAWQSAGRTEQKWIGPDFVTVAQNLIEQDNIKHIISASVGFINDNLEILYDVDIELKQAIETKGGKLTRLQMPNDDPKLISALKAEVLKLAKAI